MKIEDHPAFQGWNATVKCVSVKNSDVFKENEVYHIENGKFIDNLDGVIYRNHYESLADLNDRRSAQFELVAEPALPHICSVLCPENPLKIGEHFKIKGYVPEFWIDKFEHLAFDSEDFAPFALAALAEAINHPEKIIRRPQFSDDEKALFKAFHAYGYDFWAMTINGFLYVCKKGGALSQDGYLKTASDHYQLDANFLPHMECNQEFNAAAYLESGESK